MNVKMMVVGIAVLLAGVGCENLNKMNPLQQAEWKAQEEQLESPPTSPHAVSPVERPAPPPMNYGY